VLTSRKPTVVCAIVLSLWLAAGCTGGRAPDEGQSLVVAVAGDGYNTTTGSDVGIYPVNANIYETLVRLSPTYQIEPLLAKSWEFVSPNTWRFHLRTGVRFHDGSTLTANDVRWTMRRIALTPGGTMGLGENSAHVVDDSTIEITPVRPNRRLVEQLAHPNWSVLAAGTEPGKKTVGTGPYRLAEYVKGNRIVVERFPGYWGPAPNLKRITFRFIADPNVRLIALRSGDVDVAADLPREVTSVAEDYPGVHVSKSPVGGYEAIYINIHGAAPYDLGSEVAIRSAIAQGIDKAAITRDVWRGNAEPAGTLMPSAVLGGNSGIVSSPDFNPSGAMRTLDSAGWVSGADGIRRKKARRLSLTLVVGFPNPEIHKPMPELVQAQLRGIGIEVKIVQVADNATYQARIRQGEGDLWAEAGGQNDGNPCFLPDLLFYGGDTLVASAYARLFAPGSRFDRIIEGCRSAVNPLDVRRFAAEAMRILSDEALVAIPLAGTYRIWGLRDRVQGFVPHPSSLSQTWGQVRLGTESGR
jgi:peptide/nickel transport system substrate-binding protein